MVVEQNLIKNDSEPRMKVALIDDDARLRMLLTRMLPRFGYEAICAGDGEAGLELLRRNSDVVLVLLDWVLPKLDGIEILREMKLWADAPPVLMISSKTQKEDVLAAIKAGAVDYCVKPVEIGRLVLKINSIIERFREQTEERAKRVPDLAVEGELFFSIMDVSETGISFRAPFPLRRDAIVVLESADLVERLSLQEKRSFPVRVANCTQLKKGYRVGAEFIGLTEDVKKQLRLASQSAKGFKA